MRKLICLSILIVLLIQTSCMQNEHSSDTNDHTVSSENELLNAEEPQDAAENLINICDQEYTPNELNSMILNAFNTMLFYSGNYEDSKYVHLNSSLVLENNIEYLLYLIEERNVYASEPEYAVCMIITSINYPSEQDEHLLYYYDFEINERGMTSSVRSSYPIPEDHNYTKMSDFKESNYSATYLGKYTMCLESIEVPFYEEKSDEWKSYAAVALESALCDPDGMAKDLPNGSYDVYVQNFNPADDSTGILIISQEGVLYSGFYYFPNSISSNKNASLNKVNPEYTYENGDYSEGTLISCEKIKETAALHIMVDIQ